MKFQLLSRHARLPTRATAGSAGLDLYAAIPHPYVFDEDTMPLEIPLGVAVEIPRGFVGLVCGRSGLAFREHVTGHLGVIDSDYRSEIKALLWHITPDRLERWMIDPGERVAQLVVLPAYMSEPELADALTPTKRGSNGFGSTGS